MKENFRRAVAESYFELGEAAKSDLLYGEWLKIDPRWGWGWIGWSDCYQSTRTESRNLQKAEEILRRGLSIPGVRDAEDLSERLAELYQEQGRISEAMEVRRQAEKSAAEIKPTKEMQLPRVTNLPRVSAAPVAGARQKIGRNDPCPCGSGKKFKKCCGE